MSTKIDLNSVCLPSQDIVAREIEGDIVIVPLAAGIGESNDELYTLNESGQAIWRELDGKRTLKQVAQALSERFEAPLAQFETDVVGFTSELAHRGILVAQK